MAEELAIEVESDGGDVAGLLGTEEVACAADFEVAHGDLEAGSERGVLLDGRHALAGLREELCVAWEQEVGVGLVLVASDATAELVEFGEAEAVGAIDDDGVGVGDIEAALDDGGGDQDVGLAIDEARHDAFEVVGIHLAVADEDAGLGQEGADAEGEGFDGRDAVVEEVDLAAAVDLALDGVADQAFVVIGDDGLDGETVLGRGLEGGEVAGAGEGEVEGARDGGGGEGEDVDGLAEEFELFLVADAELLFLVDDDEAEVLELDVGRDDAVGSDDDVDGPVGCGLEDGALLFGRAEAGEEFDAHGVLGHAIAEIVVVLLGEDGGGDEDGDLFSSEHGLEGGADGDLGLAEADVAAEESIHGLGGLHVGLGGGDGAELVGGFLVFEGRLELALPGGVGRESVTGFRGAGGLDGQEFGGEIAYGALGLFLGLGPAVAAEGGELGAGFAGANVLRDEVGLADGNVEAGWFGGGTGRGVLDDEAFVAGGFVGSGLAAAAILGRERLQSAEYSDAILQVDDVVAFLELGEVDLEDGADCGGVAGLESAWALDLVAAINLGVGDDHKTGIRNEESAVEDADMAMRGWQREPEFGPEFLESLTFAFVAAEHVDLVFLTGPAVELLEELASLGLGDLRVREGGADGAVGIEARETGRGGIGEVGIEAFGETESAQAATGGLGKDVLPIDGKPVAGWHLLAVAEGLVEEGVRFGEEEEGVLGEEVEEGTEFGFGVRSGGGGVVVGGGASGGLEKTEFAGGWDDDFGNGLA